MLKKVAFNGSRWHDKFSSVDVRPIGGGALVTINFKLCTILMRPDLFISGA